MKRKTRNTTMRVALFVALGCGFASAAFAGDDKTKLPDCPLMGEPIDPSVKLATEDGPLWFCCGGCVGKYQKDTAKYAGKIATLRTELAKLPKVQVTCPVSNEPVDPNITTKHGDQAVAFCCGKCKSKFEEDPKAFAAKLANSSTIQTKCPIGDQLIDPSAYIDFTTGQRVYLCCGKCAGKLAADPAKYAKQLSAMNIHVDPATVKKAS